MIMNTIQRRQIAKGQVIDMSIARTALHKSQRQRAEAAKSLRKAMSAGRLASNTDTISYPVQRSD
jgi:hypothetical protein